MNVTIRLASLALASRFLEEAQAAGLEEAEALASIDTLNAQYEREGRAFRIVEISGGYQFRTLPELSEYLKGLARQIAAHRLSHASLETLAIVAYRQPVTKAELEQIRGVNCSLILRNLMIRGLVEAEYDKIKAATVYSVTMDFLKHLGINSVIDLPDFEQLNSDENLQKLLDQKVSQAEAKEDKVIKVEVNKQ